MENNVPLPSLRTARQVRFVKALINTPQGLGVKELQYIVGCNHSPKEKEKLVELGVPIGREIFQAVDRDGKTSYPSLYYLPATWMDSAKEICRRWEEGAATPPPVQGGLSDDSRLGS